MKPAALSVQFQNIPESLKSIDRWVMWRFVPRPKPDGTTDWTKIPFTPDGHAASTTNPATWSTYETVADAFVSDAGGFDGIGIVLTDDLHGIDLDDHRDPATGALSALAEELLERVEGYAEVSPSGTGIKVFTKTNLDGSRTKKDVGVELYRNARYFTVTGHAINGHASLPSSVQDLGWLVERVWGDKLGVPAVVGDALASYKTAVDGYDLQRVIDEVLPHLDPDCGYGEWLRIGQALHHQGDGAADWCEAWDAWSANSNKYVPGECQLKWDSFNTTRAVGNVVTLRSLIAQATAVQKAADDAARDTELQALRAEIASVWDVNDYETVIAPKIASSALLTETDREVLAVEIVASAKAIGTKLSITAVRKWLKPRRTQQFPDQTDGGELLCTLENLELLLDQRQITVTYNVISKQVDIRIPGAQGTRDNRENASIAHVLSECEAARMRTKFVTQFLLAVADRNLYNPVMTWVTSQPWDGTSRLQAFYDTVIGTDGISLEFKNTLIRKWLLQAIAAAASEHGIAGQGVLTFTGAQNIGKTTWFQRLAPDHLELVHTGHTLDLKSKDSILTVLRYWIVELGEVDATFRKSEVAALKSFITQPVDNIRRPYAISESSYGRRTVFGASVNEEQFLADATGNRRFWVIPASGFQFDHGIDMQQLWAEVLGLYQAGESWELTHTEMAELNRHNEAFKVLDPVAEMIAVRWDWECVSGWQWVTATQALQACGVAKPSAGETIKAGLALRKLNGNRSRHTRLGNLLAVPNELEDFLK